MEGDTVRITALDSARSRLFLAPLGLWLTLNAGQFRSAEYDEKKHVVRLHMEPATALVRAARLHVEQTATSHDGRTYSEPEGKVRKASDLMLVDIGTEETIVTLRGSAP